MPISGEHELGTRRRVLPVKHVVDGLDDRAFRSRRESGRVDRCDDGCGRRCDGRSVGSSRDGSVGRDGDDGDVLNSVLPQVYVGGRPDLG